MHRIGKHLISEKKATILEAARHMGRGIEKKDVADRDLLSLLIKANMATDIPESQRLSDDEILARRLLRSSCIAKYPDQRKFQRFLRE